MQAQAHPLLLRGPQGRIGLTLALESLHRSSLSLNPPGRSCDSSPVPLPMALSPSPGFRLRGQRIHDPSSCFLFYWLEALMLLSSLCQYIFVNYSNNEIKHVKMGKNWHSSCRRHWPITNIKSAPPCSTHFQPQQIFQVFESHNTTPNLLDLS